MTESSVSRGTGHRPTSFFRATGAFIVRLVLRLLLAVAYFVVVTPIALVRRALLGNPLRHPLGSKGYWIEHRARERDADLLRPS